jgi:hypothetical protein
MDAGSRSPTTKPLAGIVSSWLAAPQPDQLRVMS